MIKRLHLVILIVTCCLSQFRAQHLFYKNPGRSVISQFRDSAQRVVLVNTDTSDILKKQFDYILKFYPKMLVKNIVVEFKRSSKVVDTKPKFPSIFKAPDQRVYKIYFSKSTKSTLDSVALDNLSFNSQLGLIANQVSQIEDFSTGGFFDFFAWYFRKMTKKGRNRIYLANEQKTLEVGLGYQLLSLNAEVEKKLKIENWVTTTGYASFVRHYKNQPMKHEMIINFINDLPVYVGRQYK